MSFLFRKIARFLRQPGVIFVFAVGFFVFSGAAGLWFASHPANGMEANRAKPDVAPNEALPEPVRSVSRALLDMANLAYEEALGSPLDDQVKQADFALIQAMLRCEMPLEDAVVEKTELRHDAGGAYTFQRIRLAVGADPLPFATSLHEALDAWAERAELAQSRDVVREDAACALWTISVGDSVTHELVLASVPARLPAGEDARKFARGRAADGVARLVVVMDDLGEDVRVAHKLARLSFPVTFAVWPHSSKAAKTAETGHAAGLEIIVHQPTEPIKYPEINPGPRALLVSLSDNEIESRVRESFAKVPHAVGMNNHMGSRFTRDRRASAAMARVLKERGALLLDSLTHPGSVLHAEAKKIDVPTLKRDIFLDAAPSRQNVLNQLHRAERIALVTGAAVAIGHPLPETLAALEEWEALRDDRVEYVRLSDLLDGE